MFTASYVPIELESSPVHAQLDLTGDGTNDVHVEIVRSPAGHDVLYVHVDGLTAIRLCRPKTVTVEDRRPA